MTASEVATGPATAVGRRRETPAIVDSDVHNALVSRDAIKRYLGPRWHGEYDRSPPLGGMTLYTMAAPRPSVFRMDTWPSSGGPPGSDIELMREQLLDPFGVTKAILHPILDTLQLVQHGELGLALAAALNDWMVAEWLEQDERLYGAITVPAEDAVLAAREVERSAGHTKFAKVFMPASTREPLGHSRYWPLYEAAVAHGLPIATHVGGFSGSITPSGWPTYFAEWRTDLELPFEAQVVSLVYSGVFREFPDLRFVLEEGGLGWIPSLLWRIDRTWAAMRGQLPAHLDERPSDVIRRHFAFTTQPLYDMAAPSHLAHLFDELDMDDRILFASDYPHHDFDDPGRVLPASVIGSERRRQVISTNAEAIFRFAV